MLLFNSPTPLIPIGGLARKGFEAAGPIRPFGPLLGITLLHVLENGGRSLFQ